MATCIQIRGLIQAYIDDELNSAERILVEEHLHNCAPCQQEMLALRTVTAYLFETLGPNGLEEDLVPAVMNHLPQMEFSLFSPLIKRFKNATKNSMYKKSKMPTATFLPVVVAVLLVIVAGLIWVNWPSAEQHPSAVLGLVIYNQGENFSGDLTKQTTRPIRISEFLRGGTTLSIGKGSRVLFALRGPSHASVFENSVVQILSNRELHLEKGRIFLDVGRGDRPFVITTPHGSVKALGTSFQVTSQSSGSGVSVVHGQVLVENEKSFAVLTPGSVAAFRGEGTPEVRYDAEVNRYLEEARSVLPDPVAERYFRNYFGTPSLESVTQDKQIFMVDANDRFIHAIILGWLPDPHAEGHTGYHVYVSDNELKPLFKAYVSPEVFQNKKQNSIRIPTPPEVRVQPVSLLHITLMPESKPGTIGTVFTEVSAVGIRQ